MVHIIYKNKNKSTIKRILDPHISFFPSLNSLVSIFFLFSLNLTLSLKQKYFYNKKRVRLRDREKK